MIQIRKATKADQDSAWEIIRPVIAGGDTYCFSPDSSKEKMLAYWFGEDKNTYVATLDEEVVATFVIKDNQIDLGSHIANASYMVSSAHEGKGIGRLIGEYSLIEAKALGYRAMQFNLVIKSNERAIQLWQKLGFRVIGEVPEAFLHAKNGYTDALIMYREL